AWADLPALAASGVRVAAHTRSHPDLTQLDPRRLDDELRGSHLAIEDQTGAPCRLLAYPYGRICGRVRQAAARHFSAAFGTRLGTTRPGEDSFSLSRVDAFYLRSDRTRAALIAGRLEGRLRWRRLARAGRRLIHSGLPFGGDE